MAGVNTFKPPRRRDSGKGGLYLSLRNCKRCGKLFHFQQHSVCQQCLVKDQEDFQKIYDYMYEHPGVSALELSRETGVKPEVITRFRREGRLATQVTDGEPPNLTCESCGAPLEQGRYCPQCLAKLQKELKHVTKGMDKPVEIKQHGKVHTMNTLNKYKQR